MLERNILGEFDHPLLLRLYHSFQERDKLVLVVAYCPGGSLHTHVNISLKEDGRGFDEHRAAFYVAEIAQAIAHLHSHGIVHRDLKLENVLVCVEINQSFLGDDAAVLARSSGKEPLASMAWRPTRRVQL
tara:strand:- start:115 stop:504 length:390 start_codon:yes stop_codon:yes gene_type:complete